LPPNLSTIYYPKSSKTTIIIKSNLYITFLINPSINYPLLPLTIPFHSHLNSLIYFLNYHPPAATNTNLIIINNYPIIDSTIIVTTSEIIIIYSIIINNLTHFKYSHYSHPTPNLNNPQSFFL
jgi:hypothetical protein